ncbi:SAM-dependent methyltransferase [Kribbella sp. CA-293567]|uniref:SAM-dependent methyltransferase n=1 Tax=Kribbella sp. CA-293567 TaxID=3002436 RepID=UPI0022DD4914|nr:SAM-dependent methyltransferase [Kribbella sp. CA-293567]WBQ05898.1 SAM-dependent methyltransferase [Kribbella sp. CA-293567]
MIDVIAVSRPEDVVLDFLSVLDPGSGREVHLVIADRGAYLRLPAGVPLAGRLAPLAGLLQTSGDGAKPFSPGSAADAIALETGDVAAMVWTHSPADSRERRGQWGYELAAAIRRAPVRHAVGDAHWFQWRTDLDVQLEQPLVDAKLDFVNTHCASLLRLGEEDDNALPTRRIQSVERFFDSGPDERARLFAVMGSLSSNAAVVADPWEFATSAYELERLDATAAWVRGHLDPVAGRVIEVGACEGALTRRLLHDGYAVDATEPNANFLARLRDTVEGDVRIHRHSFEELTTTRRLTGSAYLLIEMLYYGQDLTLLDRFPTDRVFVSMEPDRLARQVWPSAWSIEEELDLVLPRVEPIVGGRAYLRKRGSRGILLRRR